MQARKSIVLLMLVVAMAVASVAAMRRVQENGNARRGEAQPPGSRNGQLPDRSHFPIANYEAPEPAAPEQRAKRRARSGRHDKQGGVPSPHDKDKSQGIQRWNDWELRIPAIPVAQSSIVVVGQIMDARGYLSNDKKGVYSEFMFHAEEILKNSESSPVGPDSSIAVSREGGRVRYPDGEIALFYISNQDMPRVHRRYVLFLKGDGASDDYSILTGYELSEGRVLPLDDRGPRSSFDAYKDMDEATFLQTLRGIIAQPTQP